MTKALNAASMSNQPFEVRRKYRGVEYVLRELSMEDYDRTIDQATQTDETTKVETFDGAAHTKILLAKSLVEPQMTAKEIYAQGTRVVRGLQSALQELYFDEEPDELKKAEKREERESAGDEPGEAAAAS